MKVYNSGWEDDSSDEEEDEPRHRSSRSTTQNTLRLSSIYQIIKTRPESKSDTQKLVDMKEDYKRLHLQNELQVDEIERLRSALKLVMMFMCTVSVVLWLCYE